MRALGVFAIPILSLASVALYVAWPQLLAWWIVRQARSGGVALDVGRVARDRGQVTLADVRFTLLGVAGLSGSAPIVRVTTSGLSAARIDLDHATIDAGGIAVAGDLRAWADRYRRTPRRER